MSLAQENLAIAQEWEALQASMNPSNSTDYSSSILMILLKNPNSPFVLLQNIATARKQAGTIDQMVRHVIMYAWF